jgi:hypothetical protein
MKWLIILGLLFFLVAMIAVRYRRQIQMGLYVFRMFRKMRQMNKTATTEKQVTPAARSNDIPLGRCAKCGSWKPQSEALKFGGNVFYCSSNCLEKAVQV